MAVTIQERPHTHSFSFNEIRYKFFITDPLTVGCALEVEVFVRELSGAFQKFHAFTLYPDANGEIYCHLQTTLRSALQPELPNPGGAPVQPVRSQIKYFTVNYRQITKAQPNPAWISDAAMQCLVIFGGVEKRKFKRNNFFVGYLVKHQPFLTWTPSHSFVHPGQIIYLTFLTLDYLADFTVTGRLIYTDGRHFTKTISYTNNGSDVLFRIAATLGFFDLAVNAGQPYYYELQIESNGVIIVNPYRFYIQYDAIYNYHDLYFFNSISGFDSIRLKGEHNAEVSLNSEEVEHISYKDDHASIEPRSQFSLTNIYKRDTVKADAGYLQTPQQQQALVELLLSKGVYQWIDGRWIRVLNLKRSQDLGSSVDAKWNFPVEWSYADDDEVYTPPINLGNGTNGPPPNLCAGLPLIRAERLDTIASNPTVYLLAWDTAPVSSFGVLTFEISFDGGVTWTALNGLLSGTPANRLEYQTASPTPEPHSVRVTLTCPYDATIFNQFVEAFNP